MKQIKKIVLAVLAIWGLAFGATAQQSPTLQSCMDAVVTCYGEDSTSPVAGVKHIGDPIGNAPLGSHWNLPNYFASDVAKSNWTAGRMGQIFGTAIDNSGNVYFSATAMYSDVFLPVSGVPWSTRESPCRLARKNVPIYYNNQQGYHSAGGPSGIYKANGSNIANVTAIINSGSTGASGIGTSRIKDAGYGIGNIAAHNNFLYASVLDNGSIQKVNLATNEIDNIYDPFNADVSGSRIAPFGERVFAVAINQEFDGEFRLYYSRLVDSNQSEIWSVALDASGNPIPSDTSLEVVLPRINKAYSGTLTLSDLSYVSDIAFSIRGEMLIALKGSPHLTRIYQLYGRHGAWSLLEHIENGYRINYNGQNHTNSAGGVDYGSVRDAGNNVVCDSLIWMMTNYVVKPGGFRLYGLQSAPQTNYISPLKSNTLSNLYPESYLIDLDNDTNSTITKGLIGDVEFYSECCPNKPTDICSDIGIQAIKDSADCCYTLIINNDYHDKYFTSLLIETDGPTFSGLNLNSASGGTLVQNSPTGLTFSMNNGGHIPDSTINIAKLCINGLSSGVATVKWIGNAPQYDTVCIDSFFIDCVPPAPPIDTNCVAVQNEIICEGGVLSMQFNLKNNSNNVIRGITVYPLSSGDKTGRVFVPIADLQPDSTSIAYSFPLVLDDTVGLACYYFAACDVNVDPLSPSGSNPQFCCMDSILYCAQVPSCDPCDAINIEAPQQSGDDCCFDLTLTNNYVNDDIACLRFKGQNGAQFAVFSGWNIQAPVSSNEITMCAPGGKVGKGTFPDFAEFCLTGTSVAPHLVLVEFLNAAGEVLCVKELSFDDCTLRQPTCANIVNDSLYCDGSKMYYTFDVQNNSPFDICHFDIRTSDTSVKTTPSFIQPAPCITQGQTEGPFTIEIDTARADLDFLCLYLTGHNTVYNPDSGFAATQCCTDSLGVICLPFLPCDSISNCCDVNNFIIPNGITPNNDGFNDTYVIKNTDACDKVSITVFNRWGNIVYKDADFKNDWQGTNQNGNRLPQGTYYILVETPNKNKRGLYLDLRY